MCVYCVCVCEYGGRKVKGGEKKVCETVRNVRQAACFVDR